MSDLIYITLSISGWCFMTREIPSIFCYFRSSIPYLKIDSNYHGNPIDQKLTRAVYKYLHRRSSNCATKDQADSIGYRGSIYRRWWVMRIYRLLSFACIVSCFICVLVTCDRLFHCCYQTFFILYQIPTSTNCCWKHFCHSNDDNDDYTDRHFRRYLGCCLCCYCYDDEMSMMTANAQTAATAAATRTTTELLQKRSIVRNTSSIARHIDCRYCICHWIQSCRDWSTLSTRVSMDQGALFI